MNERIGQELELLRSRFPNLEYQQEGRWVFLPRYPVPVGLWSADEPDVCFQIQEGHPGQKPYGFHVKLPFELAAGGEIKNATRSSEPPFAGAWLKFSWDMPDWRAESDITAGYNLLNWALSFRRRLEEGA
jgi:hypothetical protein